MVDKGEQAETTYSPSGIVENHAYKWRIDSKNICGTTLGDEWTFTTGVLLTVAASPSAGGTVDGGGWYAPTSNPPIAQTPNDGYTLTKWSTDPSGAEGYDVDLPFAMPESDTTLYAIYALIPPDVPSDPAPADTATMISQLTRLAWTGSAIFFDVYLDTDPSPTTKVSEDQTTNMYTPPAQLSANTVYYWKVVSKSADKSLTEESPVWSFKVTYTRAVGARCAINNPAAEFTQSLAGTTTSYQSSVIDHPCPPGTGVVYRTGNVNSEHADWKPNLAYAGYYRVDSTWGNTTCANPVTFTVTYDEGSTVSTPIVESTHSNVWNSIDGGSALPFGSGQSGNTNVRETPGATESSSHWRLYDACRWLWTHPNTPTDLTTTRLSETQIGLSWTGVDMPAHGSYEIWRRTDTEDYSLLYTITDQEGANPGEIDYTDTDVTTDTAYYYKVRANETDYSDYTAEVIGAPYQFTPPSAPAGPNPEDGATAVAADAQLSWSSNGASYDVYFGTDNPPAAEVSAGQTGTTYDPGALAEGTTYHWQVVAWNADHSLSTTGPVWSFTTGVSLTVLVGDIAGGTVGGTGFYAAGTPITSAIATATPDTGYAFSRWSSNSSGTDTVDLPFNLDSSTTIYALFDTGYTKAFGVKCVALPDTITGNIDSYWPSIHNPASACSGNTVCASNRGNSCTVTWTPSFDYGGWYAVQYARWYSNSCNVTCTAYHLASDGVSAASDSEVHDTAGWCSAGTRGTMFGATPETSTLYQYLQGYNPATGRFTVAYVGGTQASGYYDVDTTAWIFMRPNDVPDLTADRVSSTEIDLYWTGVDMPDGGYYRIERKTGSDGEWELLANEPGSGASPGTITYQDTTVSPGSQIFYRVLAHQTNDANNYSPVAGPVTISIGSPSPLLTAGGPVAYTVTYGGADSITLAAADVTLNKTGTADGVVSVSGDDNTTRVVMISGITGDGTLGISIAAGTAADDVGDLAPAAGPSATFDVDNTPPTTPSITSIDIAGNDATVNFGGSTDDHPFVYQIKLDGGPYRGIDEPEGLHGRRRDPYGLCEGCGRAR